MNIDSKALLDNVARDVRYAIRSFRRAPLVALTIVTTVGLGLGILLLLRRSTGGRGRVISAAVAMLWAWVAWSFLWQRYATINWAATYLAWLFALQVLLLVWLASCGAPR